MTDATSRPARPTPGSKSTADMGVMYAVAYEEAKRALDDQLAEIDGMRQRSVQFMAFIGSASAFLVGSALQNHERNWAFYAICVVATLAAIAALRLAINVLTASPRFWSAKGTEWAFRISAKGLEPWISGPAAAPSTSDFYRALASAYDKMAHDNEVALEALRRRYATFLAVSVLQLFCWMSLIWIYA